MGRMNNARRQQQNAEVINKSTRSRFSTWKPPSKKKEGKGGKGRGRGGGKGRRDEAKPEARVIGGLTVRAAKKKTDPKPQSATSAALERQRRLLKGVDVNALEAVDMSRDHARLVEELLLSYGVVDDGSGAQQASKVPAPPPPPKSLPSGDAMPPKPPAPPPPVDEDAPPPGKEQAAIWTHLTKRLCFKDARARQALLHAKSNTLSAALDWLCVTCDETELTKSLRRNNKAARVTVVTGSSGGVELAGSIDWQLATAACGLEALGFDSKDAKEALSAAKGDERRALYLLTQQSCSTLKASDAVEAELATQERSDEVEALKAIFGDDAIAVSPDAVKISLDSREFLELRKPASSVKSSLEVFVSDRDAYPVRGPPRLLFRNALLPPGVLRDVHLRLCKHVSSIEGPALYEACEWLRDAVHESHARFLGEGVAPVVDEEEEKAASIRKAEAERREADKVQKEADAAAHALADKASRVAFLKSSNSNEDLVQAKLDADKARSEALKAEGVVEDEDETDEDVVMPSQLGAEFDERASCLAAKLGAPEDACRALLKQASVSKECKRLFQANDTDKAWQQALMEAERLHGVRRLGEKRGLSVNNMPENFAPSPMLLDIMAQIDEQVQEHPYLEANNDPPPEVVEEEPEDPVVTKQALEESKKLKKELDTKRSKDETYKKLLAQRKQLPAYQRGSSVVKAIRERRVVVVSADTGAGKTTQVPQLVLDDCIDRGEGARCSLVVTQPRRISAVGVAQRVAEERAEKIGKTVGYSIRGEAKRSTDTRILLCTTGVLLRRLQCDGELKTLSHVFVDEVHERDVATDFLLIVLRRLLTKRPKLKLILMSATLNAQVFADYFQQFNPYLAEIPGRAHPVQAFYLEDALALTGLRVDARDECAVGSFRSKQASRGSQPKSALVGLTKRDWAAKLKDYPDDVHSSLSALDPACVNYALIVRVVEAIFMRGNDPWTKHCFESVKDDKDGAILIFVTGLAEITATVEKLRASEVLEGRATIHALHSQLSTQDQQAIFRRAPKGTRKIVVSTNIAETSITIDDVVYVVDAARVKENRYDADRGLATLEEVFVSRAAARQRRGRAGRVRPGVAFPLVTRLAHDGEFDAYPQPEILRTSLEDLVLQILVLDLGDPKKFLRGAVSPPTAQAVDRALELLAQIDALEPMDSEGAPKVAALTALGFHLAALPVEPRVGKLLLVGAMLGATGAALTLAAVMTSPRSIFVAPFDMRDQADEARRHLAVAYSDHLTGVAAFDEWRQQKKSRNEFRWARANFCGGQTLKAIDQSRDQFARHLQSIGFIGKGNKALREALNGTADLLPDSQSGSKNASDAADASARSAALLKALLCAGLYPNVLVAPRDVRLLGEKAPEVSVRGRVLSLRVSRRGVGRRL